MKKLLVATTNQSKFAEAAELFKEDDLSLLGLKSFPGITLVAETGMTFEENAVLKAKGYFDQIHIPCIADDGGFMVDYLNGAPGVNSHRWLGYEATDKELANAILNKLEGIPKEKRTARLGGFVVFWNGILLLKSENYVEGYISDHLMGEVKPGFPYRSILMIPRFAKPYSELTDEEHEQVNSRRKNLKTLKPEILKLLQ